MSGESGFKPPIFVHSSIDDAGLSPGAFHVLGHLVRRAGNKREAFPSVRAIAKTCHMNWATVIAAIQELEQSRFVVADRRRGKVTVYRLFPEPKAGTEVASKTTPVEAAGVTYLGNSDETQGVTHLGNGVLPHQPCGSSPRAAGAARRYSNKVIRLSADALTHSLSYEKEEEVTEKEGHPRGQLLSNAEPPENSSFSVTKSETKNGPLRDRGKRPRHRRTSGQRPESEAEVVTYVLSRGYEEEDGKYMWAHWKSNRFTNSGRPIDDWKATIDSWAYQ